jgi:hypothetical protein
VKPFFGFNKIKTHMTHVLILDLDKTLLYSKTDYCTESQCQHDMVMTTGSMHYVHWRPYLDGFLRACQRHAIHLVIFSAGQFNYVHTLTSILHERHGMVPVLVLTYDDVEHTGNGQITKTLSRVKERLQRKRPDLITDETSFLVIDDDDRNFVQPDDARSVLRIPAFCPDLSSRLAPSLVKSRMLWFLYMAVPWYAASILRGDQRRAEKLQQFFHDEPLSTVEAMRLALFPFSYRETKSLFAINAEKDDDWLWWAWHYLAYRWQLEQGHMLEDVVVAQGYSWPTVETIWKKWEPFVQL